MSSLQVRKLPLVVYQKLLDLANKEHRSISQQAIILLEEALNARQDRKEIRRKLVEELIAKPVFGQAQRLRSPEDILSEDRER